MEQGGKHDQLEELASIVMSCLVVINGIGVYGTVWEDMNR